MRCNQVSISIERFGKAVPENYPQENQRIHVYVDDFNSIYAALSKAYALAIGELGEYDQIGVRCDVSSNEFDNLVNKHTHAIIPNTKRPYENDINLQYYDSSYELYSDYVWIFEHSREILELIQNSKNQSEMMHALKERYDLSDYQIRKLSQIRLDMLTKEKYEEYKLEIQKINDWKETKEKADANNSMEVKELFTNREISNIRFQIEELEAYFKITENYVEMIRIMEECEDFNEFSNTMKQKYSLTRNQSNYFRYMSINDFSRKEQEKRQSDLERLKNKLEILSVSESKIKRADFFE